MGAGPRFARIAMGARTGQPRCARGAAGLSASNGCWAALRADRDGGEDGAAALRAGCCGLQCLEWVLGRASRGSGFTSTRLSRRRARSEGARAGPCRVSRDGGEDGGPRFARKRLPVDTSFPPLSTKWGCPSGAPSRHPRRSRARSGFAFAAKRLRRNLAEAQRILLRGGGAVRAGAPSRPRRRRQPRFARGAAGLSASNVPRG